MEPQTAATSKISAYQMACAICRALIQIPSRVEADGDPFTIETGAVIPGVAALAGYVNASSMTNNTCPTPTGNSSSPSSHDVAIGVGVGVPLGVITLASIAWALWERRQLCRRPERRRQVNISINIPRTLYINLIRRSWRLGKQSWYRSWTATGMQNRLDIGISIDAGREARQKE
ncbi:uncharacterized protein P174DRAFT_516376 [Aspergillus novofumigatus IBT 16806]|uniref:Uncharacterized protein n=1 Tax=Aspergillus novofumigatus (strain IBT 16806) TaxID=1392255 RepID=A0A2I1BTP9_ASPN1|nr:uncharacterized protein P174DRAFT_516376 [Aspergillus novofumigatus IBT 16806]PKX88770.1 hypothetical protein P174DRAFT_516376 [Aspergillus novofumigatus IBT 16806]